jgi:very-short-patch-repair endonuclease
MSEATKQKPSRYWLGKSRPDMVESSRQRILKLYESGSFPRQTNTLPERQLKEELLLRGYREGIDFIHQYKFYEKFMCDLAFPKEKVLVECDGDYWHAKPGSKYTKKSPDSARTLKIAVLRN